MADQGAEGLLSPYLRKQRLKEAKPYLYGRVLDMGCGSGALASIVNPSDYLGIDIDNDSIKLAREAFPSHSFQNSLPSETKKFDTIVSLAVIEHVNDVAGFLKELSQLLVNTSNSRIICTTPHPSVDWVHDVGAAIGLFSKHANEEHEDLLDRDMLETVASEANLKMIVYKRFLFSANQLAVFQLRSAD